MQLDALQGNEAFKQDIRHRLLAKNLPHALLLAAPDGCGRGFAARCLAADILHPQGGAPAEAVMRAQSPELLVVQGEGKSGQIPVERIRQARAEAHRTALSSLGRVVWVCDAHHMAAPAANALLKILEEPPDGVTFILTARDAASLPLTILSRCTLYTLVPVSAEECAGALRQYAPPDSDKALPQLLATVYGGRIGLGRRVLDDAERAAVLRDALEAAEALMAENRYALLRVFARYEGRAEGNRQQRDELLSDIADILEASLRGATAPGLAVFAPSQAARLLGPVQQARISLAANTSPKITFTALVAQLAALGKH